MKLKSAALLSSLSLVAAVSAVDLETANLKVSFYESAPVHGPTTLSLSAYELRSFAK